MKGAILMSAAQVCLHLRFVCITGVYRELAIGLVPPAAFKLGNFSNSRTYVAEGQRNRTVHLLKLSSAETEG